MSEEETFGSLHDKLASEGAELLVEILPDILSGKLQPSPQAESRETYASKWEKKDLELNWAEPADVTSRRIRASSPFPGARAHLGEQMVKVFHAYPMADKNYGNHPNGTIVEANKEEIVVAAGDGSFLAISEMQFPGRKSLTIREIVKGYTFNVGDKFHENFHSATEI